MRPPLVGILEPVKVVGEEEGKVEINRMTKI